MLFVEVGDPPAHLVELVFADVWYVVFDDFGAHLVVDQLEFFLVVDLDAFALGLDALDFFVDVELGQVELFSGVFLAVFEELDVFEVDFGWFHAQKLEFFIAQSFDFETVQVGAQVLLDDPGACLLVFFSVLVFVSAPADFGFEVGLAFLAFGDGLPSALVHEDEVDFRFLVGFHWVAEFDDFFFGQVFVFLLEVLVDDAVSLDDFLGAFFEVVGDGQLESLGEQLEVEEQLLHVDEV